MHQELKQKLKKKKKEIIIVEQKSESAQKLAQAAVQKQLQILRLKEWLVIIGFATGAALLRSLMQPLPSVEPLTFFAILAGWLFGKKKGFLVGVSSLYISNFLVFGGQGPWTIFQMLSFGIAGFLGGYLNKKWGMIRQFISGLVIALVSTMIFEIIMNISWGATFGGGNIFLMFLTGLPFAIVHIASNLLFALFLPFAMNFIYRTGKFNEVEICKEVLKKLPKKISQKVVVNDG